MCSPGSTESTNLNALTTLSCGKPQSQWAARHPELETQLFGANTYVGGGGGHDAAAAEEVHRSKKENAKRKNAGIAISTVAITITRRFRNNGVPLAHKYCV